MRVARINKLRCTKETKYPRLANQPGLYVLTTNQAQFPATGLGEMQPFYRGIASKQEAQSGGLDQSRTREQERHDQQQVATGCMYQTSKY